MGNAALAPAPVSRQDADRHREETRQWCKFAREDFGVYCSLVARWPLAPHQEQFLGPIIRLADQPGRREILSAWPQAGKTSIATVLAAQWLLGRSYKRDADCATRSIILASYNETKAGGLSRAVKEAFENPTHPARLIFPEVKVREGGEGTWCLNDQPSNEPSFVATGVGGGTGYPAQTIMIDDWVKGYADAMSLANQDFIWQWHTGTVTARLQANTGIIVTATRWLSDDYVGRLTKDGEYTVTSVPAETGEGEQRRASWPERFPLRHLDGILRTGGPRNYSTMYLCNPTPSEGIVWRREWFDDTRYNPGEAPDPTKLVMVAAWDCAAPKDQVKDPAKSDFVGFCRIGRDAAGHFWVYNAGRGKFTAAELRQAVAHGFGGSADEVSAIENDTNGKWLAASLADCGRNVVMVDAIADKVARARVVSHLAETRRVHVCSDQSGEELIRTLCAFPNDEHDDEHDSFVHALRRANTDREVLWWA